MKKSDIILIGAVALIILVGILSSRGTVALEEVNYPLELYGKSGLNEITYQEYETLVKNNEAFIVVIERTGCGYCQMYMPILEEVAKEKKVSILYINTEALTSEEYNALSTRNAYLKRNDWGTPTTLLMLGNRVLDSIGGYVEKEKVLSFLDNRVVMGA